MISFYPGPSRVEDKIPAYVRDAFKQGILSMNHRSPEFTDLCKKTVGLLKQKLNIPKDYTVFFISSATECWEILSQSLVKSQSIHLYNGAFGEKWFSYAQALTPDSIAVTFDQDEIPDARGLVFNSGEVICLTQNETSNGTQLSNAFIGTIKKNNPRHLIAVDVTSSMAGVSLQFSNGDVWLASVQKCFGQPAGLGVMAVSPRGMAAIKQQNESGHYNSLTLMAKMMELWQTSYTPNVLGIYLLMRTMQDRPRISEVSNTLRARFTKWEKFFEGSDKLQLLIQNKKARSFTVVPVKADPLYIDKIKMEAKKKGLLLGGGYGTYKKETFRIANFPALKERELAILKKFLKAYL